VADGFEKLAAGEVDLHPSEDYDGSVALEAGFGRFSILVAAPGQAPAL